MFSIVVGKDGISLSGQLPLAFPLRDVNLTLVFYNSRRRGLGASLAILLFKKKKFSPYIMNYDEVRCFI